MGFGVGSGSRCIPSGGVDTRGGLKGESPPEVIFESNRHPLPISVRFLDPRLEVRASKTPP